MSKLGPKCPVLTGKSVGNYLLGEMIGCGSYAAVYIALEKTNAKNKVAIKCVEISKLSKAAVENLLVEIKFLKHLNHPHVVEMKDFSWDNQFIYIIMEYCSGGDLATLVRARRGLREVLVRKYLQQMAFALQYLRKNNVSHMDLKPHNLLLNTSARTLLKIADFGFAQHLSEEDRKTSLRGSPLYMAPEILYGMAYDAKVDLWSVGVILYEMIYGSAPYSSKTVDEMLEKVRHASPIPFPKTSALGEKLSEECLDLLPKLLERDPLNRIDFLEFFDHPFVDLPNAVGPDSMEKAKMRATEAVNLDISGSGEEAVPKYLDAIRHLRAAFLYETNESICRGIRNNILKYGKRCETLTCISTDALKTVTRLPQTDNLLELVKSTPRLEAGVSIGVDAECFEDGGQLEQALEAYQNALSVLVPVVKAEPAGERRHILGKKVSEWLTRAEKLKSILEGEKMQHSLPVPDSPETSHEHPSHMTWAEMISRGLIVMILMPLVALVVNCALWYWSENLNDEENDPRLDVSSPDFDPLLALQSENLNLSTEDVRVFDNISAYETYVKRGTGRFLKSEEKEENEKRRVAHEERLRKARVIKGLEGEKKPEPVEIPTTGRRAREFHNVLWKMEKTAASSSPLSRLGFYKEARKRIKVRTRNFGEIRSECTGFLELFDRNWNLILRDVDEVYQRLVTSRDELFTEGTKITSEKASHARSKKKTPEPSEGLYASCVRQLENLNLNEKQILENSSEAVLPAVPPAFEWISGMSTKYDQCRGSLVELSAGVIKFVYFKTPVRLKFAVSPVLSRVALIPDFMDLNPFVLSHVAEYVVVVVVVVGASPPERPLC
ncbi:unnamed protein product [Notodromas monacha]|uniref:Serine/threonine-protein kinase ULK3 n=1 Tax=Notodromas monacha TaxID=399045 RepID=A0A7R9BN35_9CRUS|nr:unnamed protein product [Notodromas monacha]CAG0918555.1 unnamed protein product [Notodromas monacha]